jgi:hypothetical protein
MDSCRPVAVTSCSASKAGAANIASSRAMVSGRVTVAVSSAPERSRSNRPPASRDRRRPAPAISTRLGRTCPDRIGPASSCTRRAGKAARGAPSGSNRRTSRNSTTGARPPSGRSSAMSPISSRPCHHAASSRASIRSCSAVGQGHRRHVEPQPQPTDDQEDQKAEPAEPPAQPPHRTATPARRADAPSGASGDAVCRGPGPVLGRLIHRCCSVLPLPVCPLFSPQSV